MFCIHCGKENKDGNKFCTGCGKSMEDSVAAIVDLSSADEGNEPIKVSENTANNNTNAYEEPSQNAGNYNQQPINAYSPSMQNDNYVCGCAGQAWKDIRATPGWVGRAFFIALIAFVPILNFCIPGYFYGSGKSAAINGKGVTPTKIVNGENFKNGFFVIIVSLIDWLIFSLIFGGITYLVLSLLGIGLNFLYFLTIWPFNIIGILIIVVLFILPAIFYSTIVNLMCQRAVMISFGSAFNLGKVFSAWSRKFGTLLYVCFVPSFLVQLIVSALYALAGVLCWMLFMFGIAGIILSVLLGIFAYYFIFVFTCVGSHIAARGVGHYINRYAPQWAEESKAYQANNFQTYNAYQPTFKNSLDQIDQNHELSNAQNFNTENFSKRSEVPASFQDNYEDSPQAEEKSIKKGSDTGTTILTDGPIMTLIGDNDYEITELPAIVGKGSSADIIVNGDESVSREHLKIYEYKDNQLVIEDLNSKNKTYLNNDVLEPEELVILNDGDTLKIGRTILKVKVN